jgi:hypothetical protein
VKYTVPVPALRTTAAKLTNGPPPTSIRAPGGTGVSDVVALSPVAPPKRKKAVALLAL